MAGRFCNGFWVGVLNVGGFLSVGLVIVGCEWKICANGIHYERLGLLFSAADMVMPLIIHTETLGIRAIVGKAP